MDSKTKHARLLRFCAQREKAPFQTFSCLVPMLLVGLSTACGPAEDGHGSIGASGDIAEVEGPLYQYARVRLFTDNNWEVPVCFLDSGYAGDKLRIRDAIKAEWGANSGLTFSGWGMCPASPSAATVPIKFERIEGTNPGSGVARPGMGSRLSDLPNAQVRLPINAGRDERNHQRAIAVHEMGHVIGMVHEHQRPDRHSIDCLSEPETNPDHVIVNNGLKASLYDPHSIMNYCRDFDDDDVFDRSPSETNDYYQLTSLDKAGIQLVYGRPPTHPAAAGFVWSPTDAAGTLTAASHYSYNSAGATNTITHNGTPGSYRVDFPRIGSLGGGGNVQVSAWGTSGRCKVASWATTADGTLQANVRCFTVTGAPADTGFTASYFRRTDTLGARAAYVWAEQSTTASYTPFPTYSWNSSGGAITVQRSGTGAYRVILGAQNPTQSPFGGTVQVTAYDSSSKYCKVLGWQPIGSSQTIDVRCFTATGAPADSQFSLAYSGFVPDVGPYGTPAYQYARADQPTTTTYTPVARFQTGSVDRGDGTTATITTPVTVRRNTFGNYSVTFALPLDSNALFAKTGVQVTAVGASTSHCNLGNWTGNLDSSTATVTCHTPGGLPVDSEFTITFLSTLSR